ncbi:MAG: beta-N-acetylhexosaminidase, partial [Clostridia bacterium]|nr:beta-N-acetylhexosaminidase [Clostridia bacterium]
MASYKRFGAMIDCSRNAVLNISAVKRLIDGLAKMGYNTLELYTEDTFEVEGEPYFGYLRGRYSGAEIKEIDAYASAH